CCHVLLAPAPPQLYPLSLHDALPISVGGRIVGLLRTTPVSLLAVGVLAVGSGVVGLGVVGLGVVGLLAVHVLPVGLLTAGPVGRSEEHTSELQSRFDLVCRLLLEKKK